MKNKSIAFADLTIWSLLRLVIVTSSAIIASQCAFAGTYYVATNGSDSNSGTSTTSPWLTIQHAANVVPAGSTIYVRAGVYTPFTVNVSGSSAAGYTTFTNYPGEAAVIDGSGYTGSYDYGLVHILDQSWITISGFEIRNGSSTSSSFGPCGVCVKTYAGGLSNIQILNNYIHNITNTASSSGNAHGILVRGENATNPITNVLISGNTVTACQTGWSENVSVAANVNGFTISNNIVHDNNNIGIDCTGDYASEGGGAQAQNGVVSGNTVYNCSTIKNPYYNSPSSAGLYVDGGTNILLERNTVHDCDDGIELASENVGFYTSYVTARNNLIWHNYDFGIGIGGYNSRSTGGTQYCDIVNNTLYNDEYSGDYNGELHIGWRCYNNIFENNIVYANPTHNILVKDSGTDGSPVGTLDYNDYYSTGTPWWWWIGSHSYIQGFSSWQSSSHQDAHSIFAAPLFTSLTTPNFNLQSGSPALNIGNYGLGSSIYGTTDFAGNPRTIKGTIDIGAYED